ncbi:LexA family transcriptional regulator [Pseudogemmobacter faecipullorum]
MEARNMSQRDLAATIGITEQMFTNVIAGRRQFKASEVDAIRRTFGYRLPEDPSPMIAVAGHVGAGAHVDLVDAYEKGEGLYRVACPPQLSPRGIVAVEVEGDSMAPIFTPGTVLFYSRETIGVPVEAIGHICVCEDEAGKAWVKVVKTGSQEGTFSLISINPEAENMHGVRLKWAARVKLSLPPEMVERVDA